MIAALQRFVEVPVLRAFGPVLGAIAVSACPGIPEAALVLIPGSALSTANPGIPQRAIAPGRTHLRALQQSSPADFPSIPRMIHR